MKQDILSIDGMSCGHCVAAVRAALARVAGVSIASVSVGRAVVEYDETRVDRRAVAASLAEAGYPLMAEGTTQLLHTISTR